MAHEHVALGLRKISQVVEVEDTPSNRGMIRKVHNKGVMTFINFSTTNNSISNKVTYDETTGGRITRPENINGNWNVMGAFTFNARRI